MVYGRDGVRNGSGVPGRRGRPRSWVYMAGTVARIDLRLPHHQRLGSPLLRYVRYNRIIARRLAPTRPSRQHYAHLLVRFTPPPLPRRRPPCLLRLPTARAASGRARARCNGPPAWEHHPDNLDAQAVTLRLEVRPPPPRRRLVRPPATRRPPRPMHPAPPGER